MTNIVKNYSDAGELKDGILSENKNKSGIYRWINKINGNSYVGSGIDLGKRLRSYYNINYLESKLRPIEEALLKYGYSNFSLQIIEYCETNQLLNKEQFYLNLLTPEYNILKYAYSLLGYKHTDETISKLRNKIISDDHKKLLSSIHKNKKVTQETRDKLSLATTNYRKDNPLKPEALEYIRNKTILREAVSVAVINIISNEEIHFSNQTEAGKFLGVSRQAIYNGIKRNSIINGKYKVRKSKK